MPYVETERIVSNKDHVKYRPRTAIYVENDILFSPKFARVLLKNRFRLAIIGPGKCDYILTFLHCIKTCEHAIISSALAKVFFKDS